MVFSGDLEIGSEVRIGSGDGPDGPLQGTVWKYDGNVLHLRRCPPDPHNMLAGMNFVPVRNIGHVELVRAAPRDGRVFWWDLPIPVQK